MFLDSSSFIPLIPLSTILHVWLSLLLSIHAQPGLACLLATGPPAAVVRLQSYYGSNS